jgi:hypothetical protein
MLGHWTFFLILKGHHIGFYKKLFAATSAQIIGNVRKNYEALQIVYEVLHCLALIVLALESVQHIIVWR